MPTTPELGLRYPSLSAAPNVPQDLANLADDVEDAIIGVPLVSLARSLVSVPNNSITTVSWTSAIRNNHAMWVSGTNITIPEAGFYEAFLSVRYASQATAAGQRLAQVNVAGVEQAYTIVPMSSVFNATNALVQNTHPMELAAGAVVSFSVYQTSGGALDILASTRCVVRLLER